MKTMTLYRPHSIFEGSDILRDLDHFFGTSLLTPATRVFNHVPAVDIKETEKAYTLEMELPGYDQKNIEIHVDGGTLSITSKKEEVKEEKGAEGSKEDQGANGTWILKERQTNAFSRSFKLPENANPEAVSAEFKNGILSMEVKKRPEAQKRAIQINSA